MTDNLTPTVQEQDSPFQAKHINGRLHNSIQRFGMVRDNLRGLTQKVCQPELTNKSPNASGLGEIGAIDAGGLDFVGECERNLNFLEERLREISELVDVLVSQFGSGENKK